MGETQASTELMAEVAKKETELHRLLGQASVVSQELIALFLEGRKQIKEEQKHRV